MDLFHPSAVPRSQSISIWPLLGGKWLITRCIMGRHRLVFLLLPVAVFMAAGFAAPPGAVAREELLVHLSTKIDGAARKPLQLQRKPDQRVRILERRATAGPAAAKKQFAKLSSNHIVVIGLNEEGDELNRSVLLDPRLIRAEIFSPTTGKIIHSDQIYLEDVDFIVDLPDGAGIRKIQFFHPRWTGAEFVLDLIAETSLP